MSPAASAIQPQTPSLDLPSSARSRVPLADISNLASPPRTENPDPIPEAFRKVIRYDQEWDVFICLQDGCGYAINGTDFCTGTGHMKRVHNWGFRKRKPLWEAVQHLPGAEGPNTVAPNPPKPVVPIFKDPLPHELGHVPEVPAGGEKPKKFKLLSPTSKVPGRKPRNFKHRSRKVPGEKPPKIKVRLPKVPDGTAEIDGLAGPFDGNSPFASRIL